MMIKVGFVGCGRMMREHAQYLCAMPDVDIVGCCDSERPHAQAAAQEFGGTAFTNYSNMYDTAKPDAVYVCVPPYAHGAMEIAAAEQGLHLFIECPIALERAVAREIVAAIRKAKILSSVGYCQRYSDITLQAKRMLKGKAISLVSSYFLCGMAPHPWQRMKEHSGGQLIEQSTQCFDMLRYLCGEVAEVHAFSSNGAMSKEKDYDVDDSSVVVLRMKNGAAGSISSSCISVDKGRRSLEIVTPEATFSLSRNSLRVIEKDKTTKHHAENNPYEEENRAFIDAVRNGTRGRIRCAYPDAMKSFNLSYAATESIRTGMSIRP
jgi:myo-inositol 2-dehydrogenase / D-chiro-inositol 1-dehydrogenase